MTILTEQELGALRYQPIASAPIDRPILVRRGHRLARARWRRGRSGTQGEWIYDCTGDEADIERLDFAPTHWRELEHAK